MPEPTAFRSLDRLDYMEAWLSGYNSARAGIPSEFAAIMEAVKASYEECGNQRARRVVEGEAQC